MNKKELSRWSKENKMIVNKYEGIDLYIFATDLYVALLDIKEYIEKRHNIKGSMVYDSPIYHNDILDIINKALGSDKE